MKLPTTNNSTNTLKKTMTNTEKLQKLSAGKNPKIIEDIKYRNANRVWLKNSKKIALEILLKLDELQWSQKDLAEKLGVSPQYINKLLKGNEKFGFEILSQIEETMELCVFSVNIMKNKLRNTNSTVYIVHKTETIAPKKGKIVPIYTEEEYAILQG